MKINDRLGDILTRLRNAQEAKLLNIKVPCSILTIDLLNILSEEGYIIGYRYTLKSNKFLKKKIIGKTIQSAHGELKNYSLINQQYDLEILLKYKKNKPVITEIIRISKPTRRVYIPAKELSFLSKNTKKVAQKEFCNESLKNLKNLENLENLEKQNKRNQSNSIANQLHGEGMCTYILSTSKGIISHEEAHANKIGGEVLCKVF